MMVREVGDEYLLVGLIVVVGVAWILDGVLDQFLECLPLANKFDQFWDTAATTENHEFLLFHQEFFDGASIFLVKELVDFEISSKQAPKKIKTSFSAKLKPTTVPRLERRDSPGSLSFPSQPQGPVGFID